ncbi:MAG: hypothetical protein ABEI27_09130 [Halobellus sp.]|uniref:hypothetical protein n=1 Tax=Halobellus sp. TaxID=1979212 RepID=UPI0035D3E4D8
MIDLPWGGSDGDSSDDADEYPDALVVCSFQDGTIAVYADRVEIERVERSRFDDKTIPTDEIEGVDLSKGVTIGYLQIEQTGMAVDAGGLLSDPVNENTLHFGRGGRDCASEARTEILAHASG